jgi:ATP-dependent RNA helicase DOB1
LTSSQNQSVPKDDIPPHEQYVVDVLLNCAQNSTLPKDRSTITATPGGVLPCPSGQKGEPLVLPVLLSTLNGISHLRIFLPKDLRPISSRETVWKSVLEVQRRSPDSIPLLDPIENMGIKDEKFKVLVKVNSPLQSIFLSQ